MRPNSLFISVACILFLISVSSASTDVDYVFESKWGSSGTNAGQFSSPYGIAIDSNDVIYVADSGNHRIQTFEAGWGEYVPYWGSPGSGINQFQTPHHLAFNNSGYFYIADLGNNRIVVYNPLNEPIATWGFFGTEDGNFNQPYGIAIDSSNNVYVSDYGNHRIQKFTPGGQFITKWGSLGSGSYNFNYPAGLAVDNSGNILVCDSQNNRISKYTSSGYYITSWGTGGTGDLQFNRPCGITIAKNGHIIISDTYNHRIQELTENGEFSTKWGSEGTEKNQFGRPDGIAIDSEGNLYVLEIVNNRIQKFSYREEGVLSNSGGGSWQYDMDITIQENSGSSLTDYPVLIKLNATNFNFDSVKPDGSDIRFTDNSGKELSYWIEDFNSSSQAGLIWVKIPTILEDGALQVTMHYGNTLASSSSNGHSVFEIFDDFNNKLLNYSTWTTQQNPTILDGKLIVERSSGINFTSRQNSEYDEYIKSIKSYGNGYSLKTRTKFYSHNGWEGTFLGFLDIGSSSSHAVMQCFYQHTFNPTTVFAHTNSPDQYDNFNGYTDDFHSYEITWISGYVIYTVDSCTAYSHQFDWSATLPIKAQAEFYDGARLDIDWIMVRKYIQNEPTVFVKNENDLKITASDITFLNPDPSQNENIIIRARIFNLGNQNAINVPIEFFDGKDTSGEIIAFPTIALIPAGGSEIIEIPWTLNCKSTDLTISIDPGMTINDDSRINNQITCLSPMGQMQKLFSKLTPENGFYYYEQEYIGNNQNPPFKNLDTSICNLEDDDIWIWNYYPMSSGFFLGENLWTGFDSNTWYEGKDPQGRETINWGVDLKDYPLSNFLRHFNTGISDTGYPVYPPIYYNWASNRAEILCKGRVKFTFPTDYANLDENIYTSFYYDSQSDQILNSGLQQFASFIEKEVNFEYESDQIDLLEEVGNVKAICNGEIKIGSSGKNSPHATILGQMGTFDLSARVETSSTNSEPIDAKFEFFTKSPVYAIQEIMIPYENFEDGQFILSPFDNTKYVNMKALRPIARMKISEIENILKVQFFVSDPPICIYSTEVDLLKFPPTQVRVNTNTFESIFGITDIISDCPVDLHVYDPLGHHIGLNESGAIEREIPNSTYLKENGTTTISFPSENDKYILIVHGLDEGKYNVSISNPVLIQNGTNHIITYIDIILQNITTDESDNDYFDIDIQPLAEEIESKINNNIELNDAVNETINNLDFNRNNIPDASEENLTFEKMVSLLNVLDSTGRINSLTNLSATLSCLDSPLVGKSVDFFVNDTKVGTSITDEKGIAVFQLFIDETYCICDANLSVSFVGDENYYEASDRGLLIIDEQFSPMPVANFSCNESKGSAPLSVMFWDISSNEDVRVWQFGDGNISFIPNPIYTYTKPGLYYVNLTVRNSMGINSKIINITVDPPIMVPKANFTVNPSFGHAPLYIQFNDTSIGEEIIGYQWIFSDNPNVIYTERNLTKVFTSPGYYDVNHSVSNAFETAWKNESAYIHVTTPPSLPSFPNPHGGLFPQPTDPDQDGLYEDLDGNGWIGFNDVVIYYNNLDDIDNGVFGSVLLFDYDGSTFAGFNDVVRLYGMIG